MKLLAIEKHCCVQEYAGCQQHDTKGCKGEQVCNGDEIGCATMVSIPQGHLTHEKCVDLVSFEEFVMVNVMIIELFMMGFYNPIVKFY